MGEGDREQTVNAIFIDGLRWVLSSEPNIQTAKQGSLNLYNYFVTGKKNKAHFFFSSKTGSLCLVPYSMHCDLCHVSYSDLACDLRVASVWRPLPSDMVASVLCPLPSDIMTYF